MSSLQGTNSNSITIHDEANQPPSPSEEAFPRVSVLGKVSLRDWYISNFCTDADVQCLGRIQEVCFPSTWRRTTEQTMQSSSMEEGEAGREVTSPRGEGYATIQSAQGPLAESNNKMWGMWALYFHLWSEVISGTGLIIIVSNILFLGYELEALYIFLMLVVCMYITDCLKDYFGCPRPPCPPLRRAGAVSHGIEYGFPSTHTTCAIVLLWLLNEFFDSLHPNGPTHAMGVVAVIVALHIIFSRMFLGLHWWADVVGGAVVAAFVLLCHGAFLKQWFLEVHRDWEHLPLWFPWFVGHVALVIHASPADFCPCFVDSGRMVGAFAGAFMGSQLRKTAMADKNASEVDLHLNMTDHTLFSVWYCVRWILCVGGAVVGQDLSKRVFKKMLPPFLAFASHSAPVPQGGVPLWRNVFGWSMGFLLGKPLYHHQQQQQQQQQISTQPGQGGEGGSTGQQPQHESSSKVSDLRDAGSEAGIGRLFTLKNHIHWHESEIQATYLSYIVLGLLMTHHLPWLYETVVANAHDHHGNHQLLGATKHH